METSFHSQLPPYEVQRFHIQDPSGSYDMLEIRCPRKGCPAPRFWVGLGWRVIRPVDGASDKPPAHPVGRTCPACGKASAIPPEWRTYEAEIVATRRRLVVRRKKRL
jgi:hypothetical protein